MEKTTITIQIKGTPLIKFQSAERIAQLQKGCLYAKTLKYYRELEEETGNKEIGDGFEAMVHVNEAIIKIPSTGEDILLKDELIKTTHSDDFVFCMFGIYPQLEKFAFTEQQKEKMLSFGDTALIITDSNAFIDRVKKAAEKAGFIAYFSGVKYYDETVDNANMIVDMLRGMHNIAFWKRESYRYQQEGRFVFVSEQCHDDHIILDIGDISDISVVLLAEQVLTGTSTRN